MRRESMPKALSPNRPPTHPQRGRGGDEGGEQLEMEIASSPTVGDRISGIYRALQAAVEKFGGVTELAVALGKDKGEVSRRVRRAEDTKGDTQRAYLDYLGHFDWEAREAFLAELSREWGYKAPEPMAEPTEAEQLRALKAELRASGGLGDDVIKRAAARGGFDARAFRR